MNIKVLREDVTKVNTPALIVNIFEGVKSPDGATGAVDQALGGAISQLIDEGEIRGKPGEMTLIHTFGRIGAGRVLVAGLGKRDKFSVNTVRNVMGDACRFLRSRNVASACTIAHGAGIGGLAPLSVAQAMAEGAILGLYRFSHYQSSNGDDAVLDDLAVVEQDDSKVAELEKGLQAGNHHRRGILPGPRHGQRTRQRDDADPDVGSGPSGRRRRGSRN